MPRGRRSGKSPRLGQPGPNPVRIPLKSVMPASRLCRAKSSECWKSIPSRDGPPAVIHHPEFTPAPTDEIPGLDLFMTVIKVARLGREPGLVCRDAGTAADAHRYGARFALLAAGTGVWRSKEIRDLRRRSSRESLPAGLPGSRRGRRRESG